MKKLMIALFSLVILSISSCAKFDINEAASRSHKCPSKHAKKLHMYDGKLFYSQSSDSTQISPSTI